MSQPLPDNTIDQKLSGGGNAGLFAEKIGAVDVNQNLKSDDWLSEILEGNRRGEVGCKDDLTAYDKRVVAMAKAHEKRWSERFEDKEKPSSSLCFTLELQENMTIGAGLSTPYGAAALNWHWTLGVPYIPGSSLKGLMLSWARDWEGLKEAECVKIFGSERPKDNSDDGLQAGQIIVFDALPITPPTITLDILTPHYKKWYAGGENAHWPGDWEDPNIVTFPVVKAGTEFRFAISPKRGTRLEVVKSAASLLKEALMELGAGAKTSRGYGLFG